MQDHIFDIDTRCEILDTTIEDNSYEGQHLSAEYDADEDATYITGETYQCKDAFRALTRCHWSSSAKAWVCDGNQVAAVRAADHHWEGGRTTLARRIASWLRTPEHLRHPAEIAEEKAGKCGDSVDARLYVSMMTDRCRVAEVTEAATCAAINLEGEAKAAEPAARRIAITLRPVIAAAAAAAAHAVRSARARKAWETRRRNAARQAEILAATCEPLVTTSEALPASVAYSATPSAECCHGRTAHGIDGRVVADYIGGPIAEWSDVRHDYLHMAHTDDQYCDVGAIGRRALRPRYPDCWWLDKTTCITPAEGRRERRNARRRELYRQRRASAAAAA